ncbi:SDR family oxidoreductase [uncultured Parasphingorhabdus sp.]|uniref:SDR family NAD(P)-dependent oxidoreductase n=1 Tax=uncultured Parasphingorhabdus sp. TaxID=2709694 RepID=UPI0030D857FB|tara:strand:+ start:142677 stop:143438 length:762 start_codon:yes stop_codon:yes gene_type:complete
MIFDNTLLRDRTILVTGASSGIGREYCIQAAQLGARILLIGRDKDRLDATLGSLEGKDHQAFQLELNLIDDFKKSLLDITEMSGPLHGVFHAAGIETVDTLKRANDEVFERSFAASVRGSIAILAACSRKKVMVDSGAIVLMSSVAGHRGQMGMALYSASKTAIDSLTKSGAIELAGRNIRVNSVVAGAVDTAMHRVILERMTAESTAAYENKHLLGFGLPSDVVNAGLFLTSDASRWITGTNMIVDGGFLAK